MNQHEPGAARIVMAEAQPINSNASHGHPARDGAPPPLVESIAILAMMLLTGITLWLLYGPMIRQMLLDMKRHWLG